MYDFIFPKETYLSKLKISSTPKCNEESLRELHRAQCFAIPFENVNPFLQRSVNLDLPNLSEKFLAQNRGGYCFELNGFFLAALHAFGFKARPLVGRVFAGRTEAGPRTHQVSLVEINGLPWLADVGFGGPGLIEPIPYEDGYEGVQYERPIRLRKDAQWGMTYEDNFEGNWRTLYVLPDEHVISADLVMGNHYCSTHPESLFRKSLICTLPNEHGKVTVLDRTAYITAGKNREEKPLTSVKDFQWLFHNKLKIPLPQKDLEAIHQKLSSY